MTSGELSMAARLEGLMADAWRPVETVALGAWRLRWAWGVSRRANSVLAGGRPDRALSAAVDAAEAFYAIRGLPARFQVSEATAPAELRDHLGRRGYSEDARTEVQVAEISGIIDSGRATAVRLEGSDEPSDAWWSVYSGVGRHTVRPGGAEATLRASYTGTLLRPIAPAFFVTAYRDEVPIAVGQGVAQGEWLCVQCMGTLTPHRRQGAAAAVLAALARWGWGRGARRACLAVLADNHAARRLYRRTGFAAADAYSYLVGDGRGEVTVTRPTA